MDRRRQPRSPDPYHRRAGWGRRASDAWPLELVLRESEERFRAIADDTPAYLWIASPIAENSFINKALAAFLGATESGLGSRWPEVVHPEDAPRVVPEILAAFEAQREFAVEFRVRRHDGAYRWVIDHGAPRWSPQGEFLGYAGSLVDITDRKRAEEELRRTAAEQQALIDHAPLGVVVADLDGIVQEWNPAAERLFGWTAEEVLGRFLPILAEEQRGEFVELRDRVVAGERYTELEVRRCRKDGTEVDVALSCTALRDERGVAYGLLALFADIADRKRTEEQLRHAQKMDALGRLASGVAHDFNNLLTTILGNSELAAAALDTAHPLQDDLEEIRRAAMSATRLTGQLLAFARRQVIAPAVVSLNELVGDTSWLLQRVIGEDVALRIVPGADLWPVRIDPGQFEQVLVNLAVNARDAMPQGGTLKIETANVSLRERPLRPDIPSEDYVLVSVTDTGTGMSERIRERLFEPFFTTKEAGRGIGLGLAICHGIVTQSGGHIRVKSEVGHGSSFMIYLPRASETAAAADESAAAVRGGTETILLVEDDPAVLQFAARALRARGYTVLTAGGSAEAVELAHVHGKLIDLLVTDLVMPGLNGRQLASHLVFRWPALRVLYVSGYTEDTVVRHALYPGLPFLPKPYTGELLALKVREVLDAPLPAGTEVS